jgi:outer membrane protein insertion porin family
MRLPKFRLIEEKLMIRRLRRANGLKSTLLAIVIAAAYSSTVLALDPPAGKDVAEIIVVGNQRRTADEIRAKMNTRPGQRYNELTAQEDVGRLLAQGWFLSNGVALTPRPRMADGKLAVFVEVSELPNTVQAIIFNGANHFSADELKKLTNLTVGTPMSPAVNMAARQAILRKYHEDGRLWAGVYLTEGSRLDDTRVVFDILEGPTAKISSIDIEYFGAATSGVSNQRLKTQIQSSRAYLGTLIGGEFDPGLLNLDVVKLAKYHQNLGYLDAKVQRELVWSNDHRSVKVIFHIQEGKRFKVGKVQIDGCSAAKEESLLTFTDLRAGDYYDKLVVQGDQDRLKKYHGYRGRLVEVLETIAESGDGVVSVHYQIVDAYGQRR